MKRLSVGVVIAALVLGATAVAALWEAPTSAAALKSPDRGGGQAPSAALAEPDTAEGQPELSLGQGGFVGITISTLTDEELADLGIDHGVRVEGVLDGGPSAGVLVAGDIILAIDGQEVTSAADVVHLVAGTAPGTDITFSVLRGDQELDVTVTAGERDLPRARSHLQARPAPLERLLDLVHGLLGDLVKIEIVLDSDDGPVTLRAVVGTVEDLDVDAGTFTLVLSDGSSFDFEVTDETRVNTDQAGYLGGVREGEEALVVQVGGDVVLVRQPVAPAGGGRTWPGHGGPTFQFRLPGRGPQGFRGFRVVPELRERLQEARPLVPFGGLGLFDFFEEAPFDLDDLPAHPEEIPAAPADADVF